MLPYAQVAVNGTCSPQQIQVEGIMHHEDLRRRMISGYQRARNAAVPLGRADERACVGLSQSPRALKTILFVMYSGYITNNMDYQHNERHGHLIVSHLIWCPKRRRKVLVNQIGKRCEELIREKCAEQGWTI